MTQELPFLELIGKTMAQRAVLLPEIRRRAEMLRSPFGRERLAKAEEKRLRKAAKVQSHG